MMETPKKPRKRPLKAIPKGLTATHLSRSYKKRPVLRDVSLTIQRGEAVALLGPNGAGKTTCFYIISGLINPDSGYVQLDGQDITGLPMYRRARLGIGYLPQESSIFRGLSVEDNIRAVLQAQDLNVEDQEQLLEDLLGEFSIGHLRRTPAIALSASRPEFIMLDEPLAGVDPIAVSEIRALIGYLKTKNIGVLITDHNVREALGIVDRAYILHDGKVLMEGTPEDIVGNDDVRKVYLGEGFSL